MPWSFIIPAAASLIGGNMQSNAAQNAANTSAAATDRATQLQRDQWMLQQQNQAPWLQAGVNALGVMQKTAGNVPGAFKFGASDFTQDPGYAFRLQQGQKALDASAAARGGLISGNALRAAQGYGQEMGSQEYQNAYNRALTGYNTGVASENQLYNRQAAMAGIGQTAANTLGTAGQNYATSVGNALTNQAAISGNAGMVGANAYGNALSGIGSAYGKNPVNWGNLYGGGNIGPVQNTGGYYDSSQQQF